jgi:hypothetical protein
VLLQALFLGASLATPGKGTHPHLTASVIAIIRHEDSSSNAVARGDQLLLLTALLPHRDALVNDRLAMLGLGVSNQASVVFERSPANGAAGGHDRVGEAQLQSTSWTIRSATNFFTSARASGFCGFLLPTVF